MHKQRQVLDALHTLGCAHSVFAAICEVSPGLFSQWVRGAKTISPVAESRIMDGLRGIIRLAQLSPAPVDFRQAGSIREALQRLLAKGESLATVQIF